MTIYTRPTCAPCQAVKKWLSAKGITYDEIDVDSDPAHLEAVLKLTGRMVVPTIEDNGLVVSGMNFGELTKLVNSAIVTA